VVGLSFHHVLPVLQVSLLYDCYTNQLIPWSRALLQKTAAQLLNKFLAPYGTQGFITAFKTARHCNLSPTIRNQPTPSRSISLIHVLILSSYIRLEFPSVSCPQVFRIRILYPFLISQMRATCHVHLVLLHLITLIIVGIGNFLVFLHRLTFYKQNTMFRKLDLLPSSGEDYLICRVR
jgi:hypothetical protein